MGQNRGEKENMDKRRLNRARKKGGPAGKQEVRDQEEQRGLPYQRHSVRDAFLPAPPLQGRTCSATRSHNSSPHLNQHLHHLMLLSSGQKLEMALQPASPSTVFLSFCLLKEHLVLKIYSLQAELFFQVQSCLTSYFLWWEAFLCVVCSVKPK